MARRDRPLALLDRRGQTRRAASIESWLRRTLAEYDRRTLSVNVAVAEEWGRLRVIRPLPLADALLAATARVHDLTIVTRNVADFAGIDVRVFSPFDQQP